MEEDGWHQHISGIPGHKDHMGDLRQHEILGLLKLLKQLPTKTDFDILVDRSENTLRNDLVAIQQENAQLLQKVEALTKEVVSIATRVNLIEKIKDPMQKKISNLQLQVEALEDRNRRNNVRITQPESLVAKVTDLFTHTLGPEYQESLTIERAYRVLGGRGQDFKRQRDIICYLQSNNTKDEILQKSWNLNLIEFGDLHIQVFPDVSENTLRRKAIMKPFLGKL